MQSVVNLVMKYRTVLENKNVIWVMGLQAFLSFL